MNNLKFKVWDKEIKKMYDIDQVDWEAGHSYFTDDKYIPMQSTGLFDKNGVEIFAGYIVKGVDGNEGGPSEVFYDYGVWQPFNFIGLYDGSKFEIIGNIYESKHLLDNTDTKV